MNSINHHYIPQLYLKGFASDCGKIRVYDKKYGSFKKDKNTPKTVFFEKFRNTVEIKGIKTNIIEKLYGTLESEFAQFFNLVRGGLSSQEILSKSGLDIIKQYLAIQFWRLPMLDSFTDHYIKNLDLKQFGKRITINGHNIGEVDEFAQLILEDSDFRYYFRCFFLPVLMFDVKVRDGECSYWSVHNVAPDEGGWDNILCSDNPIVAENIFDLFKFEGKFIFPLSKTKLLVFYKREMGSPIKGQVKRKNTSPSKKIHLFFLSSHFRASTASLYHLFSHPLFRSYRFRVSVLLIRTSHPSGSRQLCFKRNCLKHGPWSVRTPENLRCHTVFNWTYYKSYGY